LVFSFLGLGLGRRVKPYHPNMYLPVMCSRPRTLSGSSALELMPLQTVDMAEDHGFLCSMICGPWVPCTQQSLGISDWLEWYKCLKSQIQGQSPYTVLYMATINP
jgi:hypothetical protein